MTGTQGPAAFHYIDGLGDDAFAHSRPRDPHIPSDKATINVFHGSGVCSTPRGELRRHRGQAAAGPASSRPLAAAGWRAPYARIGEGAFEACGQWSHPPVLSLRRVTHGRLDQPEHGEPRQTPTMR